MKLTAHDLAELERFRRLLELRATGKAATMDCHKLEDDGSQCARAAKWKPVLMVRPWVGCDPAIIEVGLSICDFHKAQSVAESFITDAGWEQICDQFAALRKAIPVRSLTVLDWRAIQ